MTPLLLLQSRAFFALTFAHLARCASAIRFLAAAESSTCRCRLPAFQPVRTMLLLRNPTSHVRPSTALVPHPDRSLDLFQLAQIELLADMILECVFEHSGHVWL